MKNWTQFALLTFLTQILTAAITSAQAQAEPAIICRTHDTKNKYFVVDSTSRASIRNRAVAICIAHRGGKAGCSANVMCRNMKDRKSLRSQQVVPFPAWMRGSGVRRAAAPAPAEMTNPISDAMNRVIERNRQDAIDQLLERDRKCREYHECRN